MDHAVTEHRIELASLQGLFLEAAGPERIGVQVLRLQQLKCLAPPFTGQLDPRDPAAVAEQESNVPAIAEAHIEDATARRQITGSQHGGRAGLLAPDRPFLSVPTVPEFSFITLHGDLIVA